jgi:SAM-dependent methyltransferase
MFPEAQRHRHEGDRLFRDGVFVDEVDRGRFERAYRKVGRPRGKLVADLGAFPGTGMLYFCHEPATGDFTKNRFVAVGKADAQFRRKVESAGCAVHEVDFEAGGDLGLSEADIVLCMEVIEHIRRPHAFLRSLCAQMRTGALLYLTTNNVFYSGYILKLILRRAILDDLASEDAFYPGHCRYYALDELARALSDLGLQVTAASTFNYGPPISLYRNRLFALAKVLTTTLLSVAYPSHIELVARKP